MEAVRLFDVLLSTPCPYILDRWVASQFSQFMLSNKYIQELSFHIFPEIKTAFILNCYIENLSLKISFWEIDFQI